MSEAISVRSLDCDGHPELLILLFPLPICTFGLQLRLGAFCLKPFVGFSSFHVRPISSALAMRPSLSRSFLLSSFSQGSS